MALNVPQLCEPGAVFDHVRPKTTGLKKEACYGLYLDVQNALVHEELISLGTLTMNLIHPREVFRPAVIHAAASVILVHNHPSGDTTPSAEDVKVTRQLVGVGQLLDIPLLDHVIVTDDKYVSLRRKGLMHSGKGGADEKP